MLQRKAFSLQKLCNKDLSWEKIRGKADTRDTKGQYESEALIANQASVLPPRCPKLAVTHTDLFLPLIRS